MPNKKYFRNNLEISKFLKSEYFRLLGKLGKSNVYSNLTEDEQMRLAVLEAFSSWEDVEQRAFVEIILAAQDGWLKQ